MRVGVKVKNNPITLSAKVSNRVVPEIKPVLHDETINGDGINTPMGVNTDVVATKEDLAKFATFSIEVVATLPETGKDKTIYLVPKDGKAPDIHDEYIWKNGAFELIGTTAVDLSEYAKKVELNTKQDKLIAGKGIVIEKPAVYNLPAGYKQLSALIFNGGQYVDTGLKGTQATSYEVVFGVDLSLLPSDTKGTVLFGSRSSAASNNVSTIVPVPQADGGYTGVNDFGDYGKTRQSFKVSDGGKYKVYNSATSRYIQDIYAGSANTVETKFKDSFTTPTNLFIGNVNAGGFVAGQTNFAGIIYSVKIWQSGTLVREFVPCVNNAGVAGLYDVVNGVFYDNDGSGSFGKIEFGDTIYSTATGDALARIEDIEEAVGDISAALDAINGEAI